MLQCSGQNYGSSISQLIVPEAVVGSDIKIYTIRYKDRKINLSVAMAMITPHHQRSQWYWYGLQLTFHVITTITPKQTILNMVARQWHCHIISIQKFHIPTATVLTSNGAGITSVG